MGFGSGGVVALVIGAWAVLWAVRATPGRELREWFPAAAAFVAAMFAFALVSGQAEVTLGLIDRARAPADERAAIAAATVATSVRPLLAALVGVVALAVAIALTRGAASSASPRPAGPWALAAVIGMIALTVAGLLDLWWMRRVFQGYVGGDTLGPATTRLQVGTFVGAALAASTWAICGGIALAEWRGRAPRAA